MNSIEQQIWGFTPEGEAVILYTMTNSKGEQVKLSNIGAGIISITVPDRAGNMANVTLGYDNFMSYFGDGPCMGKTPGRFANRIGRGLFTLDGVEYRLACNNGPNHLHGGPTGFANRLWTGRVETDRVVFSYLSPSGEENYPGDLSVEVCYDWNDDAELEMTYYAKTSAKTVVNLTNHAYFNLRGEDAGPGAMLDQELQLDAVNFLWYDNGCVPTGEFTPVKGTPMDFTSPKPIGKDISADYEPIKIGAGYDQCWVVDGYEKDKLTHCGYLFDPVSGRRMDISSTQPGVQVYTGNWLQGSPRSISGKYYENRAGVALECQGFPDSPNKPEFPSSVLEPGDTYKETIIYKFSTVK